MDMGIGMNMDVDVDVDVDSPDMSAQPGPSREVGKVGGCSAFEAAFFFRRCYSCGCY